MSNLLILLIGIIALAIAKFGKVDELTSRRLYIVGFIIVGAYLLLLVLGIISFTTPLEVEWQIDS